MTVLLRLGVLILGVLGSLHAVVISAIGVGFAFNYTVRVVWLMAFFSALLGLAASFVALVKLRAAGSMLFAAAGGILLFYVVANVAFENPKEVPPPGVSAEWQYADKVRRALQAAIPAVPCLVASAGLAFVVSRRRELSDT